MFWYFGSHSGKKNFPSDQIFDHFAKVAVRLVKFFLLDSQTSIFIYSQTYFVFGYTAAVRAHSPGRRARLQVLAGLAPSNQTVGSLLRTPGRQKNDSTKLIFKNLQTCIFHLRIRLV